MSDFLESGWELPRGHPTWQDWEAKKERITELWSIQNVTAAEVCKQLAQEDFHISVRMLKDRVARWGLGKKATLADWHAYALLMMKQREEMQRGERSEIHDIWIHIKKKTPEMFRKCLRTRHKTEAAFLQEAIDAGATIPSHVRIDDPRVHADEVGYHSTISASHSEDQSNHSFSIESHQFTLNPSQNLPEFQDGSERPISNMDGGALTFLPGQDSQTTSVPLFNPIVGQMILDRYNLAPYQNASAANTVVGRSTRLPQGTVGGVHQGKKRKVDDPVNGYCEIQPAGPFIQASDMLSCGERGNISQHADEFGGSDVAADKVQREQDVAAVVLSAYQAACAYGALGDYPIMANAQHRASLFVRQMCFSLNEQFLLTMCSLLTWLRVYVEGTFSGVIFGSVHHVASDVLGEGNPVCELLEWMTAAAAGPPAKCRIDSAKLYEICESFTKAYGANHGNTIVAGYCLSFQLIREKLFVEAEARLQDLYLLAVRVLGPSDLQTINILATLSRAQSRLRKFEVALDTIEQCLKKAPLGWHHPHRLELMVRKAVILGQLGRLDDMRRCYWYVVKYRAATLGRQHAYTLAAHQSLEVVLKKTGRWEDMKGDFQKMLSDPPVEVNNEESWWLRVAVDDRAPGEEQARGS